MHVPFNDLAAVRVVMSSQICAVIVKAVQGKGDIIPVDTAFSYQVKSPYSEAYCERYL
ncbi:MAG: hypothetical protein ACRC53_12905 [Plesiomonas sp.]|uniref:hypothetical protein n=1 Tax=Plesiomonas sp. TaxID=2486279 RepID=UPI003F3808E9